MVPESKPASPASSTPLTKSLSRPSVSKLATVKPAGTCTAIVVSQTCEVPLLVNVTLTGVVSPAAGVAPPGNATAMRGCGIAKLTLAVAVATIRLSVLIEIAFTGVPAAIPAANTARTETNMVKVLPAWPAEPVATIFANVHDNGEPAAPEVAPLNAGTVPTKPVLSTTTLVISRPAGGSSVTTTLGLSPSGTVMVMR